MDQKVLRILKKKHIFNLSVKYIVGTIDTQYFYCSCQTLCSNFSHILIYVQFFGETERYLYKKTYSFKKNIFLNKSLTFLLAKQTGEFSSTPATNEL